ncbi:MAG: SurA N-terminal domain-containing protein [Desulfobulbaceae bacterium]|nr:SurA N-terminal domain-containing protein [Desulfobulbaceae bacterium]
MTSHTLSTKCLLALLCLLPLISPSPCRAETVNRIVATVNEDVITLKDLQDEGAMLFQKILREAPPAQVDKALQSARKEMLSSLIDKKIIEQRAAQLGFAVSDQELDAHIQQMLAAKGISHEIFRTEIARMGDSETHYRSMIRTQILQSKLINFDVRSKVVITDDKIRSYYDKQFTGTAAADGFHIQQIGVGWGENAQGRTKEEARAIIDNLLTLANQGENFEELARKKSDLPSAVDGGDIGVFKKDEMAPYMRQAILAVKAGEISPVVEAPNSFQFFKLVASKQGDVVSKAPFETVKEDIRKKLYEEELQQNFTTWVRQLREQADINEYL